MMATMSNSKLPKKGGDKLIVCKNCGTRFSGNYCNHCGQKANIKRLNLHHFLHNFFHAFTHMDAGYLYSFKELAIRPGHSIREYLQGKRGKHGDPMLMLIIVGGLCSLLYNHYHIKTLASLDLSELKGEMEMFSLKFFVLAFLGYSLVFSLFDYIIFRKKGYNYFELLVMNIFACIEILFLFILIAPVLILIDSSLLNKIVRITFIFTVLTYLCYVRYQFFEARGDRKTLYRVLVAMTFILVMFASVGWKTWQELFS